MSFSKVPVGKDAPNDIYVIIENPAKTPNIKYEVDKDMDCLLVDRFAPTMLSFPAHYGYIPRTLGGDGDPVDAFVLTDVDVVPGAVVRCKPVGMLVTEDESGMDEKLICVPVEKLDRRSAQINDIDDVDELFKAQLEHFYKHYKDLEEGKWVKVSGWQNAEEAKKVILEGIKNYK
ncbi:MAG: inorganic diphosphatase [Proteobacteria bacterium]|nr:inorganic diphosphatase [Pseudomonadota bacterium]